MSGVESAGLRGPGPSEPLTAPVLVIGPGWLGGSIADAVRARGGVVWTASRSAAGHSVSGTSIALDVTAPDAAARARAALPPVLSAVVLAVAPSRTRGDTHESTYPAAARNAAAIAAAHGAGLLLYTSSTGVYGVTDGSDVDETHPTDTSNARSRALVEAEELVLGAEPVPGRVVLRVAGLYGPGRDPAPRFRALGAVRPDDDYWCNFAWRDDVVGAVLHLLDVPPAGAVIFNCSDGTPVRASAIAAAISPAPGDVGEAVAPRAPSASPRSNQRVSVGRLRARGWVPTVPTVFDGLRALGHALVDVAGSAPRGTAPYGPATPRIRRFLVALAALGPVQRRDVVERFAAFEADGALRAADQRLAEVVERSGRGEARDALAGPLMQLVRRDEALDPIAAPALAALLGLLVEDLLVPAEFALLYGAVDDAIPRASLDAVR